MVVAQNANWSGHTARAVPTDRIVAERGHAWTKPTWSGADASIGVLNGNGYCVDRFRLWDSAHRLPERANTRKVIPRGREDVRLG